VSYVHLPARIFSPSFDAAKAVFVAAAPNAKDAADAAWAQTVPGQLNKGGALCEAFDLGAVRTLRAAASNMHPEDLVRQFRKILRRTPIDVLVKSGRVAALRLFKEFGCDFSETERDALVQAAGMFKSTPAAQLAADVIDAQHPGGAPALCRAVATLTGDQAEAFLPLIEAGHDALRRRDGLTALVRHPITRPYFVGQFVALNWKHTVVGVLMSGADMSEMAPFLERIYAPSDVANALRASASNHGRLALRGKEPCLVSALRRPADAPFAGLHLPDPYRSNAP